MADCFTEPPVVATTHTPAPSRILEALVTPGRFGSQAGPAGVVVRERLGARLALVTTQAQRAEQLAETVRATFAIELPRVGKRIAGPRVTWTGLAEGQWLAETAATSETHIEQLLWPALGAHARLVDVSHARLLLCVHGPRARDALAAGVPIDLHPRAFAPGDAAQTLVAHIAVMLWRIEPAADQAGPVYELAVPRSFAGSFWRWLETTSARHGLEVGPAIGGPSAPDGETSQ